MSQAARNVGGKIGKMASQESPLTKGARRDPELYILGAIMSGAFGFVGYYLGSKPTAATSETQVPIVSNSMPWQVDTKEDPQHGDFKYRYHPGGDLHAPARDAPSALHSVIVPNVNLPKHLHEKYNKFGKEL
ncbi:Uncharacterized protein BP5553_06551 [Venustampulla echinocandica]|uniref:Uncharacterized protein n=1 Tax=Venustampulla echinocandica TaxID=2656787 RepID=A0A370TK85_9HELO|nr:Uncharacterized protein BP5553_06551 [Venustampulla echinocandica]RDL35939.1 Uncharacterized protein BP5553_06551 [Venustampulla echinocandica]